MKTFFNSIKQFFINVNDVLGNICRKNRFTKTISVFITICIALSILVSAIIGICYLFKIFGIYAVITIFIIVVLATSYDISKDI